MRRLFTALAIGFFSLSVYSQRVIIIDQIPGNTPPDATLYLASSISANNWNPGDENFAFTEVDGVFSCDIPESANNTFQGKITRGSWPTVEGNEFGAVINNRTFNFTTSDTIYIQVISWEDMGGGAPSDLPDNVITISNDFFMPQLDRNRRVRLCLPLDYDNTTLNYPVLYMHDGQNLFSASESFAGEWKVDESLAYFEEHGFSGSTTGYPGAIVVAIDNGGGYRIDEYTPWANAGYGGGEGAEYMEFIVNTLKPFVDENYRTLADRENTGIMGSSLGGLISHYGAMKYQNVFSKVGVFSPSFWFTDDIYDFTFEQGHQEYMKFYLLAGGQESSGLVGDVTSMMDTMTATGFSESEIKYKYVANGQHSEWFWAQEFPAAFEWLFKTQTTDAPKRNAEFEIKVFPNPVHDTLNFTLSNKSEVADIEVYDSSGRLVVSLSRKMNNVNLSNLKAGNYLVKITTQTQTQTFNVVKL